MKDLSRFHCYPITNEDLTQDMGTHLYNSFHSLERILEGNQELSKEVLKKFGGHVEFNGCKCWKLVLTALAGLVTVESFNYCYSPNLFHIMCPYMSD